jgi:hypothetical protein
MGVVLMAGYVLVVGGRRIPSQVSRARRLVARLCVSEFVKSTTDPIPSVAIRVVYSFERGKGEETGESVAFFVLWLCPTRSPVPLLFWRGRRSNMLCPCLAFGRIDEEWFGLEWTGSLLLGGLWWCRTGCGAFCLCLFSPSLFYCPPCSTPASFRGVFSKKMVTYIADTTSTSVYIDSQISQFSNFDLCSLHFNQKKATLFFS